MSDLASSRPVPDEPPDPRPGGPTDVSGLFPAASELFVPAAREPSDLDELALSPLAEVIADLADLRSPTAAPPSSSPSVDADGQPPISPLPDLSNISDISDLSGFPDFAAFSEDFRHSAPPIARSHPRDRRDIAPLDAYGSYDSDGSGSYNTPDVFAPDTFGPGDFGPDADDAEPTARSIAALLSSPATSPAELADAVAWCYDDAALPLLLPLARHTDAGVRRAVAQALPSVLGEAAPDDTVHALITLSADRDNDVRDWACFALGTQLSEVDTTAVRSALAARLEDPHDDTRCEALLGLARRRDPRVLAVLHERLARDNVYSLEIDAAGALGHASLHTLVRGHLSGWDDDVVARVCAALRLTDPDGVGDDLLDGLADWFRAGAPHATDEDRYWWSVTLQLLEHAEYRAPEIAEQVHYRLQSAEPATTLMLGSRLSQLAGDHGWPRWRPSA